MSFQTLSLSLSLPPSLPRSRERVTGSQLVTAVYVRKLVGEGKLGGGETSVDNLLPLKEICLESVLLNKQVVVAKRIMYHNIDNDLHLIHYVLYSL